MNRFVRPRDLILSFTATRAANSASDSNAPDARAPGHVAPAPSGSTPPRGVTAVRPRRRRTGRGGA